MRSLKNASSVLTALAVGVATGVLIERNNAHGLCGVCHNSHVELLQRQSVSGLRHLTCIGCLNRELELVADDFYAETRLSPTKAQDPLEAIERACTGIAASWCPVHDDCACPAPEDAKDDHSCPLHSPTSTHTD